jgi:hypothetical protein
VKVHWTEVAIAAAFAAAACTAIYTGLLRVLRRAAAEREQATDQQLSALETAVKALQLRIAELDSLKTTREQQSEIGEPTGSSENMAGEENRQMKPETLAAITAAATTFLGKKLRVRSAQAMPAQDAAGAWAQQGRVFVQTSHNLR